MDETDEEPQQPSGETSLRTRIETGISEKLLKKLPKTNPFRKSGTAYSEPEKKQPVQEPAPEPRYEKKPEVKPSKKKKVTEPETKKEREKEIVIIKEVEKKRPGDFMSKVKRTMLIFILIIGLVLAGGFYAWTKGVDELREDSNYLIVVVYKDVPKAASIYHKDTKESEIIELTELGALSNMKSFLSDARRRHGSIDRMVVIEVETLKMLSTDDYILYEDDPGKRIYVDDMFKWIIGSEFPRADIMGSDTPATVSAKILKSWIDHYIEKILGGYGSYTVKVILNAYRAGDIEIYPGNSAMFIMRYVAVEKIVLPV